MEHTDAAAIFVAITAFVNGAVALMKQPALGDVWRKVLPWWGRLVFFVLVALVSATLQALSGGTSIQVAIVLGLGSVGTAVMGHEFSAMIKDAKAERAEERAQEQRDVKEE